VRYGTIDPTSYDRVVDATGVERAYLGPIAEGDFVADLCQHRVQAEREQDTWINISSAGYGWCFPLRKGEFHIGYGNLPPHFAEGQEAIKGSLDGVRIKCHCLSRIRMASPFYSQPFVKGTIVGVGESIGTVGPLGGDGNLYSMQCTEMLVQDWDDLGKYQRDVLKVFDWMRKERAALERIVSGSRATLGDIRMFVQHCRRVGFGVGPVAAMRFLSRMGE
jgi:flavin-dependent dehydrogenase